MSAKRAPTDRERDPHDIVPDSFLKRYPAADSIREALRMAEREAAADWVDREDRPRCPNEDCHGTRIRRKHDSVADQPNRREGAYKCGGCGNHFDIPKEPLSEEAGKQLRLTEVSK